MSRGFTLLEVILALGLALAAVAAVVALSSNVALSALASRRSEAVQVNLAFAAALVERELRQATYVSRPSSGGSGAILEGCANAAVLPGAAAPVPLDAGQPVRWFAFCPSAETVHYHTGSGCPGSYACGASAALSFGGPGRPASASFSRIPGPASQVDARMTVAFGPESASLRTSVAIAAAGPGP